MAKYLITGGAGFIGSHFVEALLKDKKNSIRILVSRHESLEKLPYGKYDIIVGDIRDKKTIKGVVKDVDYIIHLAALTMRPEYEKEDYFKTNIDGTKNILEEVISENIKKFILFSSIAVFGLPAFNGDMKNIDEGSPFEYMEDYGESKFRAEELVKNYSNKYNFPHIIIRPTTVYGPRDHQNLLELYKVIKKGMFVVIGSGKNKMDYVFVKDLVNGVLKVAKSNIKNEDYILGGPSPQMARVVARTVATSVGEKIRDIKAPYSLALAGSWIVSKILKTFGLKSPIFPNRVKVLTRNCYFNIGKAKSDFGYNPRTSFSQGTKITSKWLKKNMLI